MNGIAKLLSIGDPIFSITGKVLYVKKIDTLGFETEDDYFFFDEVRKLYFLTEYGYRCYLQEKKR